MAPLLTICVFLFLCWSVSSAAGQGCCTPGSSPFGGFTGGALSPGSLEVGLAADFFHLGQGYEGSRRVTDQGRRRSVVWSTSAYIRIGGPERTALVVQLPFEYRTRWAPEVPETSQPAYRFTASGIGDLMTLISFRIVPWYGIGRNGIIVGLGAKWPTGSYRMRGSGLVLPVELQPGTGSTDLLLALSGWRLLRGATLSGTAILRFPGRNPSGYRFGKEMNLSGMTLFDAHTRWRVGPELRVRVAGKDDFVGRPPPNTGGARVLLGPRIAHILPDGPTTLEASLLLPLWQSLSGKQLGVSVEATLGLRWGSL